ncbi:nucleotidyltransferase-like protein [Salipaludibacillus sp. CUR1]|uniref:nucleotidyltransferase-like protein n=1 Tax=Salipaludibacillus sp. CUR1 TaxID=2820003 RepID=UPI001E31A4F0|nr:nucleotidyltransferase-like protein [Salipaludibacillus sp. CUR1]MCE7792214.1 nucleotidyltransferase-like protein [Salipaludibacillus sp. CUR1]
MDDLLRQLYQDRTSDKHTLGILFTEKRRNDDANTDYFDVVLLVILDESKPNWEIKHYEYTGYKVAMHLVNTTQLHDWLLNSSNRRVVDWLVNGRLLYDRNEYMKGFRKQMMEFPYEERQIKIGVEFSKLIRRFKDGKALFYEGHYLDSYNQIVHALHHLARLSVIEHGFYPEVTVWQQVKKIEPEIHKLYSELVTGAESIEKRLELLIIANEFELMTKTKMGSAHLIDLMQSKQTPWTIQELKEQLQIHDYSLDLSILVEYLVQKGYIDVVKEETKGKSIYHRQYVPSRSLI